MLAAAANNPSLLDPIRQRYAETVARLAAHPCSFPRAAIVTLAVDGLMMGEVWRLTPFTPEQREQIVSELLRLVDEAFDGSALRRTRIAGTSRSSTHSNRTTGTACERAPGIERPPHETALPRLLLRYCWRCRCSRHWSRSVPAATTGRADAPPPPEVTVAEVAHGALPLELEYTGRTAGSREVEVRARVSGILLERRYEEGSAVAQGRRAVPDRSGAVSRRRGAGARRSRRRAARSSSEARRQRDRIVPLFEKNAVSQSQRDEAVSGFEVAQANSRRPRRVRAVPQLDLGYTDVRAPIGGLTSREVRSEGSLVTAGSDRAC